MEYAVLNTGAKMPLEGFGVFQIRDHEECERVVYDAIRTGYRLLDTAASYGNEEAVGVGVKKAIADGLVTREDLFITTKVWVSDARNEQTAYEAVKTSLKKLDLPYMDLVLLHQAMGDYFAAYYETTKSTANFDELYESFITVCEEVIALGLNQKVVPQNMRFIGARFFWHLKLTYLKPLDFRIEGVYNNII